MYRDMEQWNEIRQRVLVECESKRSILRETGMHWTTLEKILTESEPPGYQLKRARAKRVIGPYLEQIQEILKADVQAPRKQRHSAMRIFRRIQEGGYLGGYTQVKEAVNEFRRTSREVYVPLEHQPGEAQVDFGHAYVKEHGELREVAYFVMSLPYSDAMFVKVYERECTESFWDGHIQAFAYFGGVPWRISYDNTSIAVKEIAGRERDLTAGFLRLQSHYLFKAHFCQPARGNEKGVVEGAVGFSRRNFMVPVPELVSGLDGFNVWLQEQCRTDMERQLRGQNGPKAELLKADQAAFRELPAVPFEGCRKLSTASNSLSLVRFDHNDYSVPVEHAHRMVVVKGFIDRVEICRLTETIAVHPRLWNKADVSFDPLHYLALLERKPGALEHARPLSNWQLPECFEALKRRLEDEREADGKREYIRVLRLLEKHSQREVATAIEKGLALRAHTRDAIAQFLIPQEEWRATTFNLDGHPHLRLVKIESTNLFAYRELRQAGGEQ